MRLGVGWYRKKKSDWQNRPHQPTMVKSGISDHANVLKIDEGQQKNKNRPHQATTTFALFLPINFLPLPAPP